MPFNEIHKILENIPGIENIWVEYWIVWIKVDLEYLEKKYKIKNLNISKKLLEKQKIGVISGENFGEKFSEYIRIAYGREDDKNFKEGFKRLKIFFE